MNTRNAALIGALFVGAALANACQRRGPELTCKVNDQCFACPDEKARANCLRDPTASRCKWAEPSHCK